MKKDLLIGIDVGSSNVKTVIYDSNCQLYASETQEYTTILPQPGWTEYAPEDWWDCVKTTIKRALEKSQVNPERVAGIGLSSLACCPVPMDENGKVLYNGIPWSDQRAQAEVDYLINKCEKDIFEASKNKPTIINAIPHLMWIKNHEPGIYRSIYKYSEPSGFLAQRFTGEFTLDYSFASAFEFGFDVRTLDWNQELIKKMGLDVEKYPRVHPNIECIGLVTKRAATETGLVEGIPVYAGGPDTTSGALGAGVLHPGQGYYSAGSGGNIIVLTDNQEVVSPYLISWFHAKGPQLRILDGVQGSIGYSVRWLRDQFCGLEQQASSVLKNSLNAFEIMTAEGLATEPGAGGLIYLPYLFGKFHPIINSNAKGVLFGLSPMTTRAQTIRAIMEGCSYDMYQSLKSSLNLGLNVDEIIITGGPSKSDLWCQIMADVTNRKILTVKVPEASPFGDAILAGVGTGVFSSFEEVAEKHIRVNKIYEPIDKNHDLYEKLFEIYEEIYRSTLGCFDKLAHVLDL
jgi:xylulokinase